MCLPLIKTPRPKGKGLQDTTCQSSDRLQNLSECLLQRVVPQYERQLLKGSNGPEAFLIGKALQMAADCLAPLRQVVLLASTEFKHL
jgi:hypothetical protein